MNPDYDDTFQDSPRTYEAAKAQQSNQRHPDRIHWEERKSFRGQPYRLLHHQRGKMGTVSVRLVEASDLKRSYWSALALPGVKHLGLSTAHGEISSFCSLGIDYQPRTEESWRQPAEPNQKPQFTTNVNTKYTQKSPTAHKNNNPVWENCNMTFDLHKGAMPVDGMKILLRLRMDEDSTAVENILPGIPSGGDTRLIGVGCLDITSICLGENTLGQTIPGVLDAWIPISMKGQPSQHLSPQSLLREATAASFHHEDPLAPPKDSHTTAGNSHATSSITGMVRVIVTYEPHGLEPMPRDIIALECFARRSNVHNSCRPLLPPLMPLQVIDRRSSYILAEYTAMDNRKACVRLHRNAVFVIERQSLVDAAQNLALLPVDCWMATPVGQAVAHAGAPIVAASKELLMPALLSIKLIWMGVRTAGLASLSGATALASTLLKEGSSSLTSKHSEEHMYRRHEGGAHFVQL